MKMTEPTGETHDSSVELGFSLVQKSKTEAITDVLQDPMLNKNKEIWEFQYQLRAIGELFTKGLPNDSWMSYQKLKNLYNITVFEDAPNYEQIQGHLKGLIEEASKASEPEVRDFIEHVNELFIEYPNLVSLESEPLAPTVVKVDAYWNESPLESTAKCVPMQTVVYLSDGTIRPYAGNDSYINVDHLPAHVKEAIETYDNYYYPKSTV